MKGILLTIFNLFLIISACVSQVNKCSKSTEGTDFWFGFMEGRNFQREHKTEITLTSIHDFNYTIYIGNLYFSSGSVTANTPTKIPILWQLVEAIGSETIQNKAIHLVTDKPVNVYALNYSDSSSDVALIYPTGSLGQEYYAMCYQPFISAATNPNFNSKNSEFLIVASRDTTTVTIRPTKVTDGGKNTSFTVILNQGELYQVQSYNQALPGQGDLTGSYITSDKPIAFFSGSYSVDVPSGSSCCYDHLYEQIPPVQAWGKKFLAVPLKTRALDYYRVLAAYDQTKVYKNGTVLTTLNKGEHYEFPLNSDQASLIESDQPVLLVQYAASNSVDRPPGVSQNNWDGDPFMVVVSPVNQTRGKVSFVAYSSQKITNKYFINTVVKDEAVELIKLDGSFLNKTEFKSISGSGYSFAQINITQGNHTIESSDPEIGFTAYVYGFGGVESYGYGVGYSLDIVLDIGRGEADENNRKFIVRCDGGDPVTLNAGGAFDTFEWSTGETTPSIQVTDTGTYHVKARTKEGCELRDTVKIVISKPVLNLGNDTTICNPENLLLDGSLYGKYDPVHDNVNSFLWKTPVDELNLQTITAAVQGTYNLQTTTKHGCIAADEIKVNFTDVPKLNFDRLDTLICGQKSALLDISADKGNFTLESPEIGYSYNGLLAAVPAFGSYPFKVTATDEYGCASESTFKMGFHDTPTIVLNIDSTECYHYNLNAKYMGNAVVNESRFTWIFGGDTIADGLGIDTDTVHLGVNRSKRDLVLEVTQKGCSNADTIKDIKVIPNLSIGIADTLGCEPFTAEFTAHNTETVYYDWDYGDGNTERKDNHPLHTYQDDGFYNVTLKVTTVDKGCTNSISIDSMLYVAPIPTIGFTNDSLECLDLSNHQVSYLGSGNQKDTYHWDLSAFDAEEIIQHPDTTQGPLIFNLSNKPKASIFLHVITQYGCKSDTARTSVKRIPSFSIGVTDSTGCIPLEAKFTGIQSDPVDRLQYFWDYGDGTTGSGENSSHIYNTPDSKYTIILRALSDITQCSDTRLRDTLITVYPEPKAGFSVDHSIVYNDKPDMQFENLSEGSTDYLWDFGEGSTSIEVNPSYKFREMGYHRVLLEAFNQYVCSDTLSQEVLVAFARIFPPNAFSPNAPNPVDRMFKLDQIAIKEDGYHLVILSRWNDIVFETKNEIKGWDGKMRNGDNASAGNYVWVLDFIDFLGRKHKQTGAVTLVY